MQFLPYALAAVAAGSKIYGGIQTQKMYNLQAEQSRLQGSREALKGRIAALNYNNQALDVLKNYRKYVAAVNARSAAGGVRGGEGSAAEVAFQQGVLSGRDFDITRENAIQAVNMGLEAQLAAGAQADIYRSAGKTALVQGVLDAGVSAFMGFKAGKDLATPSSIPGGAPVEERSIIS
jgi:hypothetical protein